MFLSAQWVLRVAVALEFAGHGTLAIMQKASWIPFVTYFGFSQDSAQVLMPLVGTLDIALAVLVLIRPIPVLLAWMTFWGLFTAALRPLTGHSILDFVERGPNWGAPLALLLLVLQTKKSCTQR